MQFPHGLTLDQKFAYALALAQERRDARKAKGAKPECRDKPVVSKTGRVVKPATVQCGSVCRQKQNCRITKKQLDAVRRQMPGASRREVAEAIKKAMAKKREGMGTKGALYEGTKGARAKQGRERIEARKRKGERPSTSQPVSSAEGFRNGVDSLVESLQKDIDMAESRHNTQVEKVKQKHNKRFKAEASKVYPPGPDPNKGTPYEGRDRDEDGFVIPKVGEKVQITVRSVFGTGSRIYGEVYKGKNGVRVRVTSKGVGGATYVDLDGWKLPDDPEHARKEKVREIQSKYQKAANEEIARLPGYQKEVDSAVERIKGAALKAGYQEKDSREINAGDHVLDLSGHNGVLWASNLIARSPAPSFADPNVPSPTRASLSLSDGEPAHGISGTLLVAPGTKESIKLVQEYEALNKRLQEEEDREYEERERLRQEDMERAEEILAAERAARLAKPAPPPKQKMPTKKKVKSSGSKTPKPSSTTGDEEMDARLARYRERLSKNKSLTGSEEKAYEVLLRREKADPSKWGVGEGVGYRVGASGKGGQINRGFQIIEVDPESKKALVRSVADTGITVSGGMDRLEDRWVHVGDLVRDKKYRRPQRQDSRLPYLGFGLNPNPFHHPLWDLMGY